MRFGWQAERRCSAAVAGVSRVASSQPYHEYALKLERIASHQTSGLVGHCRNSRTSSRGRSSLDSDFREGVVDEFLESGQAAFEHTASGARNRQIPRLECVDRKRRSFNRIAQFLHQKSNALIDLVGMPARY